MKQIRSPRSIALALVLVAVPAAAPALAQTGFIPAANPEADSLAREMRVLAANPRDVRALLEAGKLSVRLGDTAAALAFFARAEAIDPTNPRILSGRGSTLVRMERPGEALRLFQTAEARGLPAREYAADRGFAYDLLGQPVLAQADYKLALQGGPDDETVRRYALSLGITGEVEESMRQLDPLLRKSDRAAWRARAFVLAMNGDMPGAEKIAASMMPGNMGTSLAPFFRRLANLAPADRAFAVHFGQFSPTAIRLADARQAPALPRYVPAVRPTQMAQAQAQPARPPAAGGKLAPPARRTAPAQSGTVPVQTAAAPAQTAAAASLPAPPSAPRREAPMVQPIPAPRADQIDSAIRETAPPVQVARREALPTGFSTFAAPAQAGPAALSTGGSARAAAAQPAPATPAPAPATAAATPARQPVATLPGGARPRSIAGSIPAARPLAVAARSEPSPPGPARVGQEDSVLASIVAGITIPGEELQIVTAVPVDLPPEPVRAAPAVPEVAPPASKPEARPAPPKPVAKPQAHPAKPDPVKPDPKAKKPEPKAKAEPARVWVQVAGGANEASLPKAWRAVVAKAPALKGKSGWWTPLRATNRVLTGPFKTTAEAQSFVNTLGKSGVSGFVFTSEAGQKVTKLAAN